MNDNSYKIFRVNEHEYKVFSNGDIVSLPYNTKGCVIGLTKERMIKPFIDKNGYTNVELGGITYKMHYLIASLFIDNPNNAPRVIHIDGDKSNNAASNLKWSDSISKNQSSLPIPNYSFSLADLQDEEWKAISNTNNHYFISSYGRVKSCHKRTIILSPKINSYGYAKIAIVKNGKRVDIAIHRLVASEFIGDCNGYEIDHVDGNRLNNNMNNLRIVTHTQNMNNPLTTIQLKKRKGPMTGRLGKTNHLSKPIYAVSDSGEILEFEGSWDANRKGYNYSSVQACLHGRQKTYKGLKWFFR